MEDHAASHAYVPRTSQLLGRPPWAPRIDNPSYATKCRRWRKNHPDPTPAKAPKRLASRFNQVKTGHALTGKYLKHIGSRESDACCGRPGASQTREHLLKSRPAWRQQQKVLWKEVRKRTKRGCDRFRMADLVADERCSKAVLRFLETVPKERPTEEDSDSSVVDYASEPEEEASAQQASQLAEMETELGVLPWMCPGQVCKCGLCRGEPPGGE